MTRVSAHAVWRNTKESRIDSRSGRVVQRLGLLILLLLVVGCGESSDLLSQRVETDGGWIDGRDKAWLVFDDGSRIELRIYGQTDETTCLVVPITQTDIVLAYKPSEDARPVYALNLDAKLDAARPCG